MAFYKCGRIYTTSNSRVDIDTKSGSVARFNTSLAMPVLGCNAEFSATQDLHGQSAPYPAGGGKNLIDLSSMVSGYVTTTGTFSSAHSMGEMRSNFIPVKPNTNYIFSIVETTGTADDWVGIGLYEDNDISSFIERKKSWSFTTSEDTRFIVVSARNLETATKIQLEEGSEATDYAPYSNICPIVGVDKVNLTDCGKNLISHTSFGTFADWKGDLVPFGNTPTSNSNRGFALPTKAGQTYTLSFGISDESFPIYLYLCKSNRVDTSSRVAYITTNTKVMNRTYTFTADSDLYYLRMNTYDEPTFNTQVSKCSYEQLEFGDQATEYEPYNGTNAIINLGGTYYGGSVDAVTRKIPKKWNYINLGDLEWFYNSTNGYFYNLTNITPKSGTKNWLCTTRYLKPDSVAWSAMEDGMAGFGGIQFRVKDSSTTSSAQFKQNINGTYLAYELETPETEYASNTAELYTKAGLNNVFCDTGDIEVKYRKLHSDN